MRQRLGLVLVLAAMALALAALPARSQIAVGPLRVVLLVDSSSAVSPMLTQFREALNVFIDEMPDGSSFPEIAFISTGGQLRVRVPPTTDRARLKKEVAGFASDGGANAFVDSMMEADKRFLRPITDRKPIFVLVMTDLRTVGGEFRGDLYNNFARDFVRRHGRAHGVVIHGVNLGLTTDVVMNITGNTGGYYEGMAVANSLPARMREIADMVKADIP